jgi:hypothetical protein
MILYSLLGKTKMNQQPLESIKINRFFIKKGTRGRRYYDKNGN